MRSLNIMFFSLINLLFIVVIQLITLTEVGPTGQTDALFAGMAVPTLILSVMVGSLTNVLVSIFVHSEQPRQKLWEQLYFFLSISIVIVVLLISTHDFWLGFVFSGFDSAILCLTSEILTLQFLVVPLSIASAIITAYFNAQSKFIRAEAIPAICSVIIFPSIFYLIPLYGVIAVSYIYAAKVVLTLSVQAIMIGAPVKTPLKQIDYAENFNRIKYLLLGSIYYKSGPVIDRHILSNSPSGTMSFYVLVQQLLSMANLILVKVIIVPQITIMNNLIKNKEKKLVRWVALRFICLLGLTLILFLSFILTGKPILTFIMSVTNFDKFDPEKIWIFGMALFGTFIGDFVMTFVSSAYYSKGDTRTPSLILTASYTFFIPLRFFSFFLGGTIGLAIISSAFSLVTMFLLFFILMIKLKNKHFIERKDFL